MIIYLKNKHTLKVDEFYFKCSVGKKGLSLKKKRVMKRPQKALSKLENCILEKIKNMKLKLL